MRCHRPADAVERRRRRAVDFGGAAPASMARTSCWASTENRGGLLRAADEERALWHAARRSSTKSDERSHWRRYKNRRSRWEARPRRRAARPARGANASVSTRTRRAATRDRRRTGARARRAPGPRRAEHEIEADHLLARRYAAGSPSGDPSTSRRVEIVEDREAQAAAHEVGRLGPVGTEQVTMAASAPRTAARAVRSTTLLSSR